MEGIETPEDPMEWDLTTVYFELSSRPWVQNPDALVAVIVDQGLDGKTLLTFEHLFSRRELMDVLGFTTARQKALMVEEVVSLQARSSAYRSWKKAFNKKLAMGESLDTDPRPEVDLRANHSTHAKETPKPVAVVNGEINPARPADPLLMNGSTSAEHAPPTQNGVASNAVAVTEPNHDDNERPLKKRRIVPTNINTEPLSDVAAFAPEFQIPDPALTRINHDHSHADSSPDAYLGREVLDFKALRSHAGLAHPQVIEHSDGSFAVASRRLPPGFRSAVAGVMRNILARNGRHESLLKQGLPISRSPSPSDDDDVDGVDEVDDADDQEDVVDASDLPDEWDEQTRREIEEEQAEVAARERELARCLSPERVEAILKEALEVMKTKWEERKQPQHQRKAFQLWTAARRTERIKQQILEAHRMAQFHDSKINQMVAEILKDKWVKEQDVRDQALIMEQRLHDKLYQSWLASVLELRVPPERPVVVPRPRASAPKPRPSLLDDEVLTSDDDSMDGFIVDDEEPRAGVIAKEETEDVPMMDQPPHTHSGSAPAPAPVQRAPSPVVMDLTQIETSPEPEPEPSTKSRPLATPVNGASAKAKAKAKVPRKKSAPPDDTVPPAEDLGNVQTIAQSTPKYWSQNKDRWRMIISMIFKFGHDRRQRLFSFIRDKTPEDIWESSIREHLDGGAVTNWDFEMSMLSRGRLVGIDLAIVLFSLHKCKPMRDKRIEQLDRGERNEIRRLKKKALWPNLVAFLRAYAPRFPTDDQIIFRVEPLDDWIDGQDIPDDEAAGPSSARRRAPKEIVQDKDALALRKEEERRLKYQEERSKKLRATMESAGVTSKDRRRLIINESKEEDQALIYVNQEIGSRIKDHQINGVRFLWNQIIRDVGVRQGCLLAHTMGLGKTLQVITFLVSIVEAASSTDLSVVDQIPDDLKKSQTLVLCPAGLVANWEDEVLRWAPRDLLGDIRIVEAAMLLGDRYSVIRSWADSGGLLIIGYEMFQGTCSEGGEIERLLVETPSIVIADEAHVFKNPSTKINQACSKFRTRSRIALTGTPLSNNVEEYYSMIDWVAPNFLGPLKEFKETYSHPINQGLESDSGGPAKKEALKMLEVLKRTIEPKVNRADISSIKSDLPPKHEFVLFVSSTEMQKRFYNRYIDASSSLDMMKRTFAIANDLTLICNHPRCYEVKVKTPRKRETKAIMDTEVEAAAMVEDQMIAFVHKETQSQDMNDPGLSQKVELLLLILDEAKRANEKVIVFSQSILTLNYLETLLSTIQKRTVCRLDGDTKVTVRHEQIKNFNKGLYDVYLISSKAGSVGLNIQGANRVVIFDIKWNPAVTQQAIGRAYRIGQTKTVYVYHLMVAGTFEEVLHDSSVFKMQLASRVVDKKNPISWGKRCGSFGPVKDKPAADLKGFRNRDSTLDRLIEHSQKDGRAINRIISTDTFEEEDLSAQVTPEMNVQIEEFMKLDEMRRTDPQGYEQAMIRRQMADLGGYRQTVSTGRYYSSLGHGMDGASDLRFASSHTPTPGPSTVTLPIQSHQVVPYPQSIPVPPPMAGANTYFKEAGAPQSAGPSRVAAAPQVLLTESMASVPLPKKGGIFGPSQSHARDDFEKKLIQQLPRVECVLSPPGQPLGQVAGTITARIAESLREQAEGILYDNSRWSLLSKLIDGERFLLALATGRLRMDFLARAKAEQLEQRMSVIESLSNSETVDHFMRIRTPDPNNLGNIGRSRAHSARATEDLEAMQQLALQRSRRGSRLPQWASQALSQNLDETSTPSQGS